MASFKTFCYQITPLTNMHVGSGDANYGIIDKLVQRDPVTNHPTIHSSSLKGALREYFVNSVGWDKTSEEVNTIFGSQPKERIKLRNGEYRFYSADLLMLPVRSSYHQFYLASQKDLCEAFISKHDLLKVTNDGTTDLKAGFTKLAGQIVNGSPVIFDGADEVILEDWTAIKVPTVSEEIKTLNTKFDNKIALFNETQFKELSDQLPIIARNHLENGMSKNLWYEEVVAHHSVFYTFVTVPFYDGKANYFDDFNSNLDGKIIQVGGNASIGYGCCEFKRLDTPKN